MARTETIVQLTEPLVALLDRVAAARRVSRSQVIRDAVEAYLETEQQRELGRQMADGYRRMPQDEAEVTWADRRRRESWDDLAW